jgi:hypothetical protein
LLNPFSDEGRRKINVAAARGLEYNDYRKDTILESLETIAPALKDVITRAMEQRENAKREPDNLEHKIHVTGVQITEPAVARSGRKR